MKKLLTVLITFISISGFSGETLVCKGASFSISGVEALHEFPIYYGLYSLTLRFDSMDVSSEMTGNCPNLVRKFNIPEGPGVYRKVELPLISELGSKCLYSIDKLKASGWFGNDRRIEALLCQ